MTKHEPIEIGLKCPISIEDANPANLNVNDLVEENVERLYVSRVYLEETPKLKNVRVKKARTAKRNILSRAVRKLYNMESNVAPEKDLHIDLDLYQMETY